MKLYTEEQVKKIQQAILCNHKDAIMDENYCLNVSTPIELPTDDELFQQAILAMEEMYGSGCDTEIDSYFRGAKWMQKQLKSRQ